MEQKDLTILKASIDEIDIIYELIKGLANYEKRPEDMTATKEMLKYWIFQKKIASAFLAKNEENEVIGYAIYYPIFGSFAAKANAHLEDLFISPKYRHKGYGKVFLNLIIEELKKEGYSKLEWSCLDWNLPSIEFYNKFGATKESGRVYFEYNLENK